MRVELNGFYIVSHANRFYILHVAERRVEAIADTLQDAVNYIHALTKVERVAIAA